MPRVPVYQSNQVGPVRTTGARFRPADNDGGVWGGIGAGLQELGRAGNDYAVQQDRLDAEFDDTQSRKLALEYQTAAADIKTQFKSLEGGNAVAGRTQTEEALTKLREETLAKANNPRMRSLATERVTGYFASDRAEIGAHALQQSRVERKTTLASQRSMAAESAVAAWDTPDLLGKQMATMSAVIDDQAAFEGWSRETTSLEKAKATSGVHKAIVDRMLSGVDSDVGAAEAYFEAHMDQMLAGDRDDVLDWLREPLQLRQAGDDFTRATSLLPAEAAKPGKAEPTPSGNVSFATLANVTAQTESGGRERRADGRLVTSSAGAQGKMQVMPGTNRDPGFGVTPARDNSDAERTRVGNDYLKAMLARYNGDPAKAWAAYNGGPGRVDAALAKGGDWLSQMPAETQNYVKKNMRAIGQNPNVAPDEARRWDKEAVYGQIDTLAEKEGWTFERKERAKKWADQQIARDENLLQRREADADRQASETVLALGDKFTSLNQIPAAIRDRMNPADRAKYDAVAERNRAPKEPIANGPTSTTLNLVRISEPDKFMQMNLGQYVGQVTRAELDTLVQQQAQMRVEARKPKPGVNLREGITGAISWGQKYGGVKIADSKLPKVYDTMEAFAKLFVEKSGRAPTADEYSQFFKTATRDIDGEGATYNRLGEIPQDFRDKFMRNWRGSRPPTEGDIQAGWIRRANQLNGR